MGRQKLSNSVVSPSLERKQRKLSRDIKREPISDDEDERTEIEEEENAEVAFSSNPTKHIKRLKKQPTKTTIDVDNVDEASPSPKPLEQPHSVDASRPKRKATNAHFFRYLQTRNPSRLEEEDLRRALEASLEECPDYWPEDTASCSSSDQSNAPSSSAGSSTGGGDSTGLCNAKNCKYNARVNRRRGSSQACFSRSSQICSHTTMQHNHHLNHCNHHCHSIHSYSQSNHPATNCHTGNCSHTANNHSSHQCCPHASVHRRYKPVAKKNIYDEADFFHDGIMEYIEYELMKHEGILG